MLKKLDELNKDEKIQVLTLLANQEISKTDLTASTLFATQYKDYLSKEDPGTAVICLGPARLARTTIGSLTIEVISNRDQARPDGATEQDIKVSPPDEIILFGNPYYK